MTPDANAIRFLSFLLVGLFALLSVYQSTHSIQDARVASVAKRSVLQDVTIRPRQASGEDSSGATINLPVLLEKYFNKGTGLMCQLRDIDPDNNLASEVTIDQFNKAYTSEPYEDGQTRTAGGIAMALERLGLPLETGSRGLQGFIYIQSESYMDEGEILDGTGGYYIASASPQAGYISAEDNDNFFVSTGVRGPEPRRLSDIYFFIWQQAAKNAKELRNIQYFVRFHVVNTQSKAVALQVCGNGVPDWPGKDFDMSTREGRILLGSPNGAGVAFFLINHKEDLGIKVVKKVTVFKTLGKDENGKPEDWIHFIFHIGADRKKKGGKRLALEGNP